MMQWLCLAAALAASVALAALQNGDFEQGIAGWSTGHTWYEQPKGAGMSVIEVADGEGRDGSKALKITGAGNRGIAMQVFAASKGRYRIAGWIRTENLGDASAQILAEWMDEQNKWISGSPAEAVTGTADWKWVEATVDAPAGTRSVHFDLLVNAPNSGTAWFDEVVFERVKLGFPPPNPPDIKAVAPPGGDGCLRVTWDPATLGQGVTMVHVYCEEGGFGDPATVVPRATFDAEVGEGIVHSLDNGVQYELAATCLNGDGDTSPMGPRVTASPADLQAPRPGWLQVIAGAAGRVRVRWWPHTLEFDLARLHVMARADETAAPSELETRDLADVLALDRPFYCTEPWVELDVALPEGAREIGVSCEDTSGNRGEAAWVAPAAAADIATGAPCALWTAPATEQLPTDAPAPAQQHTGFDLLLMRGQAKGFQVMLRPEQALEGVRVEFEPLRQVGGDGEIDPRWLAWHFVDYVKIDINSRATPREELVWSGPAEYPDELADDLVRDLEAGRLQPIYVRVTAPRGIAPGRYQGRGFVRSVQGSREFEISVEVSPVALADKPRLQFVYWDSWDEPCREFGVEPYSADGWRVLARHAQLMQAHHQNVFVAAWSRVKSYRLADGRLVHDFRLFDRYLRTLIENGVDRRICLSHMGSRTTGEWGCPTMGSHGHVVTDLAKGEQFQMDVIDLLPALEKHIEELGLLDRCTVHVADEPIPVNLDSYRELSARVKAAAPKLPRIDAVHVPNLEGALEVWVPQLNYFEQWLDQYKAAQAAGNEVWFYVAWVPQGKHPNRMIDSHAIKSRVLHWLNAMYDTDGYLHWALNRWSIPLSSLESPGDQYICWPSRRFVSDSSLRYEAEREGLEDCELMFMLTDQLVEEGSPREQALAQVVEMAGPGVRGFQDYSREWADLETARKAMLDRLAGAGQ